jgi:hypothetical protein
MSRPCDAIGCTTAVRPGRFMCLAHWRLVPLQLQRTINARYRANPTGRELIHDQVYLEACAQAIEHGQPEGTPPNSYRRVLKLLQATEKTKGVA